MLHNGLQLLTRVYTNNTLAISILRLHTKTQNITSSIPMWNIKYINANSFHFKILLMLLNNTILTGNKRDILRPLTT